MKHVEITIGGVGYAIKELPRKENRAWRAKLQEKLGPLVEMIQAMPNAEINKVGDLAAILARASDMLLNAIDDVIELIIEYSPALRQNEHALDTAFDSEILAAFGAILKLAFPFDSVIGKSLSQLFGNGSATPPETTISLN